MHSGYLQEDSRDRSAKTPLAAIVLVCAIALVAIRAYAAEAAPALAARSVPTVEGKVTESLRPGVTTTVRLTVENPSSHARRVGEIVLTKIAVDAGHPSCPASIAGPGANFAMPPVEVDRSYPPGRFRVADGHLTMLDTGFGQNACRGAVLTLTLRAM